MKIPNGLNNVKNDIISLQNLIFKLSALEDNTNMKKLFFLRQAKLGNPNISELIEASEKISMDAMEITETTRQFKDLLVTIICKLEIILGDSNITFDIPENTDIANKHTEKQKILISNEVTNNDDIVSVKPEDLWVMKFMCKYIDSIENITFTKKE